MTEIISKKGIVTFLVALSLLLAFAPADVIAKPKSQGMVNLDFQDADIKDVIKSISEITGKNFILDDRIRGKVTIISPTPVSIDEAYQAFLSSLEIKNYTVVKGAGRTYKVVPLRTVMKQPIATISDADTPYGDTFITRLITIRYISSSEIANTLKALVSPNGNITSYSPTNTLIVTDAASNIRRLMKIIGKLDKEGSVEGVEIVPLKHASAQEIAQKLLSLFPSQKEGSLLASTLRARRGIPDPAVAQSISKIIPDDRTNSLIVVANRQGLERILDLVKRLDIEVRATEGRGKIHVHYLEHADAEEMSATLSSLSSGSPGPSRRPTTPSNVPGAARANSSPSVATLEIFEGQIKIAPDLATNSLVITASGADYEALKSVIGKLDIPRPQVFVEALILEVNMTKGMDVGMAGSGGGQFGGVDPTTIFGASQLGGLSSLGGISSGAAALGGLAMGFQGSQISVPTGDGSSINLPIFGAIFRANQENGVFNIVSTPNILTTDNKEAEIVVGDVIPIVTQQQQPVSTSGSTSNILNSISREKVATTLKVTPQINESDFVTLDIYQEVSEITNPSGTYGPTTSTRSAKTTVVVQDNQTVVIGGLIKDKQNKTINKVPILGDIPLLGLLFRHTSVNTEKINLMIFITPHIIHRPMDMQRVTVNQNKKRRLFNKSHKIEEHPGIKTYGIDETIDFNSVRSKKKKETLRKNDSDDYESDESTKPKVSPTSRRKTKESDSYTQVKKRKKPRTDDSFFKEDAQPQEIDDSDYISDDMLFNTVDSKPKRKRTERRKTTINPFNEVAPPSSTE